MPGSLRDYTHDSDGSGDTPPHIGWDDPAPFAMIPTWLFGRVKPTTVVLYGVLASFADNESGQAWPGVGQIAARAGLSTPTVRAGLKELDLVGVLRVEARYRPDGGRSSNNYWLRRTPQTEDSDGGAPSTPLEEPPLKAATGSPLKETEGVIELDPDELDPDELDGSDAVERPDALTPEPERLAHLLADLIAENGSRRPTVTAAWVRDLDRMHRLDGRTWAEIEGAVRWSQADDFWRGVVLSPGKLRAKFDTMRLQANRRPASRGRPNATDQVAAALADYKTHGPVTT